MGRFLWMTGLAAALAIVVGGCTADMGNSSNCTGPSCRSVPTPTDDAGTLPPGPRCRSDADCGSGERCSVGLTCIVADGCAADGDCAPGHQCAAGTCVLGSDCGAVALAFEPVPANLLVSLDRSCSMRRLVGTASKWQIAVDALADLSTRHESDIRWGLTLFPDRSGAECRQDGAFPIPVGPGNAPAMRSMLTAGLDTADALYPAGPCVTNIDTGMEQAATDPALSDPERSSYVLLVTDGKQSSSCRSGSDARTFVAIEALAARGVRTFVVGFGGEVDPVALGEFARLGGTERPGGTPYYQADDAAGLAGAFDEILSDVVSCTFRLASEPTDPAAVFVFFDDATAVPRDMTRTEGWDYAPDARSITFYGGPCDALRDGTVGDVDVVFGCPEPILE